MALQSDGNYPLITLNDDFIQQHAKCDDKTKIDAFRCDFLKSVGKIIRIENLQKFSNLRELSLIGHELTNIAALKSLPELKILNLSWNSLTTLALRPLAKLTNLDTLTLNYNNIDKIPSEFSSLRNLKILRLAGNPINDRSQFLKLKSNINLVNLDLEGTLVFNNEDSILFCVYILPQLSIINRSFIDTEFRRKAAERFERNLITELNNQINNLDKELQSLKKENNDLQKSIENNSQNREEIEQLQKTIQSLQDENEKQKNVIQLRSDELAEERKKNAELITQIFPDSEEYQKDGSNLPSIHLDQQSKEKIENLEKENEELKEALDSLEHKIANLNNSISQNK